MNTWVEISNSAIQHNLGFFRSIIGKKTLLAAVVKSNAYGHSSRIISRLAMELADALAVNSEEEAILLRGLYPQATILVMGVVRSDSPHLPELNDKNTILTSSSAEEILQIRKQAPLAQIHFKTDTGMGRLGFAKNSLAQNLAYLKKEKIKLSGISTHFASTEDFTEHSYSMKQLEEFQECIAIAKQAGFSKLTRHCASSASTMLFPQAHMDMVRIGIAMYGLWPSLQTQLSLKEKSRNFILKPVLGWKTRIVHINDLPSGSFVGYGSTFKTTHPTRVAVVPVGYFEGLDRKLSNTGFMLVRGEKVPVIGRVCMNMTMLDVTNVAGVMTGDEVVIIGKSGKECISADDIALQTNTINYEVVTRINSQIPRIETE